jgi:hypothetical protein
LRTWPQRQIQEIEIHFQSVRIAHAPTRSELRIRTFNASGITLERIYSIDSVASLDVRRCQYRTCYSSYVLSQDISDSSIKFHLPGYIYSRQCVRARIDLHLPRPRERADRLRPDLLSVYRTHSLRLLCKIPSSNCMTTSVVVAWLEPAVRSAINRVPPAAVHGAYVHRVPQQMALHRPSHRRHRNRFHFRYLGHAGKNFKPLLFSFIDMVF